MQRIERYFVPDEALKEALLNALCHKQYESGIPIQISVYEDKLYIANCGRLPENWTIENLMTKHASKPYNPGIANVYYLVGFIENWGRGVEKICNACKSYGAPLPEYTVNPGDIMIKFTVSEDMLISNALKGVTERVTVKVTEKEQEVLSLPIENPAYTYSALTDKLGISRKAVSLRIKSLKEKGIIKRIGSDKRGHWDINNDFHENSNGFIVQKRQTLDKGLCVGFKNGSDLKQHIVGYLVLPIICIFSDPTNHIHICKSFDLLFLCRLYHRSVRCPCKSINKLYKLFQILSSLPPEKLHEKSHLLIEMAM